jgi:hypothetical protein
MNSRDQSLGDAVTGILGTNASDVWGVTGGTAYRAFKGEKQDEGAKLLRLARDNNPLLNVWYTSALWDHWLWYNLQEAANPGYLDRMMQRQEKYGRSYYWDPHDALPSQGPDLKKVAGQ